MLLWHQVYVDSDGYLGRNMRTEPCKTPMTVRHLMTHTAGRAT